MKTAELPSFQFTQLDPEDYSWTSEESPAGLIYVILVTEEGLFKVRAPNTVIATQPTFAQAKMEAELFDQEIMRLAETLQGLSAREKSLYIEWSMAR